MPTAQGAKDGQRDTLHDNNVTQFMVKHYSYINAIFGYLIEWLTGL